MPGVTRFVVRVPLLALLAAAILARPAAAAPLAVFDDQLRNGFSNWSWGTYSFSQTAVVRTGTAAISHEPDAWAGLFFHRDAGIDTAVYDAFELYIRGAAPAAQSLTVALTVGGNPTGQQLSLTSFITGGTVPSGSWAKVRVPFASLGVTTGVFDGFWLQDATGGNQPTLYVDDVQLTERSTPIVTPAVTVAINPALDRRVVSPLIYGVNFGDVAQANRLHWPVRRWGGNSTTRYDWQHDISNHASDWFFYNIENDNANPGALPNGSSSDVFIDQTRAAGGEVLLTVPTIGWTPIDRVRRWGFSVAKYGPQQGTECTATGNPSWCQPDAGNGIRPNGTPITGNDPHDTSRAIGPDFVTSWMAHIAGRVGTGAQGGVRFFALDNEPALWNSTHRDVHPNPLTYDELWQRTRDYAAAIKAQDPSAKIFGPADWGWCAYFYSAADGCSAGADAAAHGGLALYDWYLKQVRDYELAHGVRLVDYLDAHYYPQGQGIALSDDESAATAARRLRSLKGLYDPSYSDESWIGQPVNLIPRMKAWINARLPGAKLALTEYNWGNDNGVSSTLAQAEALAIFGREGVDLATRWVAPEPNTRMEDAFLLYLNYDGAGAKVSGESVRAVSSDIDGVGSYALRGPGGRLYVLLFNKDTASRSTTVTVAGAANRTASLYRFDGTTRLGAAGTVALASGAFTLNLPPRSATLAAFPAGTVPGDSANRFYALPPCRAIDTRNANGPAGGPALTGGTPRNFALAGRCGIPAGARAVSANLTIVGSSADGNLRAYPSDVPEPGTSAMNFRAGQIRANNAILPVAQDGNATVTIRPDMGGGSAHFLLDVNGYFAPPA